MLLISPWKILYIAPDDGGALQHLDPFGIAHRAFFHFDFLSHPFSHLRVECGGWTRTDADDLYDREANPILERSYDLALGGLEDYISKAHLQIGARGVFPEPSLICERPRGVSLRCGGEIRPTPDLSGKLFGEVQLLLLGCNRIVQVDCGDVDLSEGNPIFSLIPEI